MKKTYNEITHNEIRSLSSDLIMGTSISYKVPHIYYVTAMWSLKFHEIISLLVTVSTSLDLSTQIYWELVILYEFCLSQSRAWL